MGEWQRMGDDSVAIMLSLPERRVLRGVEEGITLRLRDAGGDTTAVMLTAVRCRR
jgi:hypothetical protein